MVKNILAISAGHGDRISGAVGIIDEHNEAVKIVKRVAQIMGSDAVSFVEKRATSQNSNLSNIKTWHNSQNADLNISVHLIPLLQAHTAQRHFILPAVKISYLIVMQRVS